MELERGLELRHEPSCLLERYGEVLPEERVDAIVLLAPM